MKPLSSEKVIRYTGHIFPPHKTVSHLKKHSYEIIDQHIAGDAPKNFIRICEYKQGRRNARSKWPKYIAKVGHKWYPAESITEHFLTRVGETLGLRMAQSKLILAHGQIRYLSKYFLTSQQILVHGAEIFAGHLQDEQFVHDVEAANRSREFFTVQFVIEALQKRFPEHSPELFSGFVRMIAFDALVGNNDRHFYNWGVIEHIQQRHAPYFAPVYDTARALFWNHDDAKLQKTASSHPKEIERFLTKYVNLSQPKTGWEGEEKVNHLELVAHMYNHYPEIRPIFTELVQPQFMKTIMQILECEFGTLMHAKRKQLIIQCLEMRQKRFREIIGAEKL